MVIRLSQEDLTRIISNALRKQAPEGATGVWVRFHARGLGDDVEVVAHVKWLGDTPVDCRCERMTPCNQNCPCGFKGSFGTCTACGVGELRKGLKLIPGGKDGGGETP